jgi:hypothetical protein
LAAQAAPERIAEAVPRLRTAERRQVLLSLLAGNSL